MDFKNNENNLEKSGYSYLENSQFLYPEETSNNSNAAQQNYQNQLQNYQNQLNQSANINNKYHFQYTGQQNNTKKEKQLNQSFNNININDITFGGSSTLSLGNSVTNIPLSKTQVIDPKKINPLERCQLINQKGISLEQSTLFKSDLQDLSSSLAINKKNKLITKCQYVGFVNNYGDNSCYVNVVLHLLYNMTEINNILKDIRQIDEIQKETEKQKSYNGKTPIENSTNKTPVADELLSSFGEILSIYDLYSDKVNCVTQITIINNEELRKKLDKYSNGIFTLNYVADPVELLLYLLDILNQNYESLIHKNFYLDLVDKINCSKKCSTSMRVRFDKDNFSYHIYVDELLNYIRDEGKKFKETKENLFSLSLELFTNEIKVCEKCSVLYDKYLFCFSEPKYLLINCVWKNQVPEQKDILDFLFLLSVEEDLRRLFMCSNSSANTIYNLQGMILYSYSLCHYTILLYNKKAKVFAFHNDDIVKEYKTLYECFSEILTNNIDLYDNDKAYFYPTMLFYTKENIYDKNDIKLNELSDFKYVELSNKIEETKNNYIKRHTLTEEQKRKNLEELIRKQQEYEQNQINQQKNKNKEKNNEIRNIDNNMDINNSRIKNIDNNLSKSELNLSTNMKEKKYGSDFLNLTGEQNIIGEKNLSNHLESAYNIFNQPNNDINNNTSIQSEFFKDIREQSNENREINNPKDNNILSSQRMQMKNVFNEIEEEDNNLAKTQLIPNVNYFDKINNKTKNNNINNINKHSINNNNIPRQNNRINMSQQIFNNNNFSQSINEQNNNYLGKSQQIFINKK